MFHPRQLHQELKTQASNSATGTRAQVARVRAEYPNQLDCSGADMKSPTDLIMPAKHISHTADKWSPVRSNTIIYLHTRTYVYT